MTDFVDKYPNKYDGKSHSAYLIMKNYLFISPVLLGILICLCVDELSAIVRYSEDEMPIADALPSEISIIEEDIAKRSRHKAPAKIRRDKTNVVVIPAENSKKR